MRKCVYFISIILFGFTTAFAGSIPEGEGTEQTRTTGKVYRCFGDIGHTLSTARNTDPQWAGYAAYCVPKRPTHCMKDWDWSLDNKNDTVTETEASKQCKFRDGTDCWPNGGCNTYCHVFSYGAGRGTPVESYFYCVFDWDTLYGGQSQWLKVAKCVDKDTGKDVPDNQAAQLCDKDRTGARYYYKPRCDAKDTKEQCENKLKNMNPNFGWRFCYEPPSGGNVDSFWRNQGGKTVRFREFQSTDINGVRTGPCNQYAFAPSGGTPPDETPDPDTWGNIIIMDEKDKDRNDSLIHTKVTGEEYFFRIRGVKADGTDFDGGIKNLTCNITDSEGNPVVADSAAVQRNSGIVSKALALFTGKMGYRFPSTAFKPQKSGEHTITCKGLDSNDTELSASASFFIAPHKYVYERISATFENSTTLLSGKDANGLVTINLLKDKQELQYSKSDTIKNFKKVSVKSATWAEKPVVRIGDELKIRLSTAMALTKDGAIDSGVDYKQNKIGSLSADIEVTTLAITNPDNPESAISASGTCKATAEANNQPASKKNLMTLGVADTTDPIVSIVGEEAQVARANINIYDIELYNKIRAEDGTKCNVDDASIFFCPYPAGLSLTNFDYEIAPSNFKVEVLDSANNPIKVLYFGQGTSPKTEAGSRVRVTAMKRDGNETKTFTNGCAAQDMQFVANDNNTSGNVGAGYYFEIIGRDGDGFSIKAKDFKDGIAGSDDAIIKVQKDKDTPFTPAMKSEPVIIGENNAAFPAQIQYEKFPAQSTYYPKYENVTVSQNGKIAVLRARINSLDTDNGSGGVGGITPTKVWYEFQCEYCDISKIAEITGQNYTNADRSPTQQGWWIDRTFGDNNGNYITTNKMEVESGGVSIGNINPNNGVVKGKTNDAGSQSISYGNARQGTHKLNIRHGNESTNNTFSGATTMPYFLLYNAYWSGSTDVKRDNNGNIVRDDKGNTIPTSTLISPTKWNTSSFIYVKGNAPDDKRDYGVDTGKAKNTRSGGRTGKF